MIIWLPRGPRAARQSGPAKSHSLFDSIAVGLSGIALLSSKCWYARSMLARLILILLIPDWVSTV
jgi:hypothetical protein